MKVPGVQGLAEIGVRIKNFVNSFLLRDGQSGNGNASASDLSTMEECHPDMEMDDNDNGDIPMMEVEVEHQSPDAESPTPGGTTGSDFEGGGSSVNSNTEETEEETSGNESPPTAATGFYFDEGGEGDDGASMNSITEEETSGNEEAPAPPPSLPLPGLKDKKKKKKKKGKGKKQPHVCPTCGKGFITKVQLTRHIQSHKGERPFPCKTCGKRFSGPHALNRHQITHSEKRPHICAQCGKGFKRKSILYVHEKTHSADRPRPFVCHHAECSRAFFDAQKLKRHLLIHSDERPFKCEICGLASKRKDAIDRHVKIAHNSDWNEEGGQGSSSSCPPSGNCSNLEPPTPNEGSATSTP